MTSNTRNREKKINTIIEVLDVMRRSKSNLRSEDLEIELEELEEMIDFHLGKEMILSEASYIQIWRADTKD